MPKNRVAFLALESDGMGAGELLCLTGFVRCASCSFVVHTERLDELPEHYCARRQRRRQEASSEASTVDQSLSGLPECERCDDTELDPDAYIPHQTANGTAYRHAPCSSCQPQWEEGDDAMTVTGDC